MYAVIEGIDTAGKSTQLNLLKSNIQRQFLQKSQEEQNLELNLELWL